MREKQPPVRGVIAISLMTSFSALLFSYDLYIDSIYHFLKKVKVSLFFPIFTPKT